MISVRNLSCSYGSHWALKNVSFDLYPGDFVGVIGPNGSGKTTLLKCLCRLLRHSGAVYINGEDIMKLDSRSLAREISYVPSDVDRSADELTVFELASSGRTPHLRGSWWEDRGDEKIIIESIRIVGLEGLERRKLKSLSAGERQRARIAVALSQASRILLVDEPTVHLDIKHQVEIMSILKELADGGAIVMAVLHDLTLASMYANKIMVLKNGELVSFGRPSEILTEDILRRVYEVEVDIIRDLEGRARAVVPALDRSRRKPST